MRARDQAQQEEFGWQERGCVHAPSQNGRQPSRQIQDAVQSRFLPAPCRTACSASPITARTRPSSLFALSSLVAGAHIGPRLARQPQPQRRPPRRRSQSADLARRRTRRHLPRCPALRGRLPALIVLAPESHGDSVRGAGLGPGVPKDRCQFGTDRALRGCRLGQVRPAHPLICLSRHAYFPASSQAGRRVRQPHRSSVISCSGFEQQIRAVLDGGSSTGSGE